MGCSTGWRASETAKSCLKLLLCSWWRRGRCTKKCHCALPPSLLPVAPSPMASGYPADFAEEGGTPPHGGTAADQGGRDAASGGTRRISYDGQHQPMRTMSQTSSVAASFAMRSLSSGGQGGGALAPQGGQGPLLLRMASAGTSGRLSVMGADGTLRAAAAVDLRTATVSVKYSEVAEREGNKGKVATDASGAPTLAFSRKPRSTGYTPFTAAAYEERKARDAAMLAALASPGSSSLWDAGAASAGTAAGHFSRSLRSGDGGGGPAVSSAGLRRRPHRTASTGPSSASSRMRSVDAANAASGDGGGGAWGYGNDPRLLQGGGTPYYTAAVTPQFSLRAPRGGGDSAAPPLALPSTGPPQQYYRTMQSPEHSALSLPHRTPSSGSAGPFASSSSATRSCDDDRRSPYAPAVTGVEEEEEDGEGPGTGRGMPARHRSSSMPSLYDGPEPGRGSHGQYVKAAAGTRLPAGLSGSASTPLLMQSPPPRHHRSAAAMPVTPGIGGADGVEPSFGWRHGHVGDVGGREDLSEASRRLPALAAEGTEGEGNLGSGPSRQAYASPATVSNASSRRPSPLPLSPPQTLRLAAEGGGGAPSSPSIRVLTPSSSSSSYADAHDRLQQLRAAARAESLSLAGAGGGNGVATVGPRQEQAQGALAGLAQAASAGSSGAGRRSAAAVAAAARLPDGDGGKRGRGGVAFAVDPSPLLAPAGAHSGTVAAREATASARSDGSDGSASSGPSVGGPNVSPPSSGSASAAFSRPPRQGPPSGHLSPVFAAPGPGQPSSSPVGYGRPLQQQAGPGLLALPATARIAPSAAAAAVAGRHVLLPVPE